MLSSESCRKEKQLVYTSHKYSRGYMKKKNRAVQYACCTIFKSATIWQFYCLFSTIALAVDAASQHERQRWAKCDIHMFKQRCLIDLCLILWSSFMKNIITRRPGPDSLWGAIIIGKSRLLNSEQFFLHCTRFLEMGLTVSWTGLILFLFWHYFPNTGK